MKSITIVVSPLGQVTVQTRGFLGAGCQAATRVLEEALGCRTGETLTADYYETQIAAPIQQQQR